MRIGRNIEGLGGSGKERMEGYGLSVAYTTQTTRKPRRVIDDRGVLIAQDAADSDIQRSGIVCRVALPAI